MTCPVCHYEGPHGPATANGARESCLCPRCGCSSRHRAIAQALAVCKLPVNALWEVGGSPLSKWLHRQARWYLCSELTAHGGATIQDLEHSTLPSGGMDIIVCSDVLEHVRDYRKAIRELLRVLTPTGACVLTVPIIKGDSHESFCALGVSPGYDIWAHEAPIHVDPLDPAGCRVYRYYSHPALTQDVTEAGGLLRLAGQWTQQEYGIYESPTYIMRRA